MVCCVLLCVHSSFAIILKGKRGRVALLFLSSWCLVIVVRLPQGATGLSEFCDHTIFAILEILEKVCCVLLCVLLVLQSS